MSIAKTLCGVVCAATLLFPLGCSTDSMQNRHIVIDKIFSVKSSFSPDFKVVNTGPTGIDPLLLTPQKLPPGITLDPPDCAKYALSQPLRPGLKGNMASLAALGENNRLVAVAVETVQPVAYEASSDHCRHIALTGRSIKGEIYAIDAPHINGAKTLGTYRVMDTTVAGRPSSTESYNYTAYLGNNHLVLVEASPVLVPNQPRASVNVDRARRLLTDSVAAVRG
jgi:Domain of unknown function (DUF5642)